MSDDAKRFRNRAVDCRALAKGTRTLVDASMLEDLAAELEAEADKIDAEEARTLGTKSSPARS
jgi:hypothetical protein